MKYLFSKMILVVVLLATSSMVAALPEGYPETPRQKHVLVDGWQFYLDKGEDGFKTDAPKNVSWQSVTIPHTLELAPLDLSGEPDDHYQLHFHRWVGWYTRELTVNAAKDQRVFLEFEGAHQVTNLWVNGKRVGEHALGGYTPFHFDITDYVHINGKPNQIVLSVDNRPNANVPPEGDRYDYIKWGGLYRDVYLVVTDPVHISFAWEAKANGVTITTPTVDAKDATISIRTHVKNESAKTKNVEVINRVIDQHGKVVLKLVDAQKISAQQSATFQQTGGICENVRLWSVDDPYLYRVNTLVRVDGRNVDCVENPLGIRRIEFIDGRGFVLNGKNVELIGVNRHQGMVFIGDAMPNSLHWKDAWLLKQAGFNSVRLAHYPHDDAFLDACDRLGILVYEEPPTWIGIGNETWMDNLEIVTRRMVRNHRNHPSVLFWGAAINHRGPVERLHYACKDEDPTRPTASNGAPWTGPRSSGVCDIYAPMDYQNLPIQANEFTYLCEHGGSSDVSSNQFETSKSREMANMIGVALWTAHDYQSFKGRPTLMTRRPWTAFRVPNMPFYWYQSELLDAPMIYIADDRASSDKEIVVYSNCQKVELYQDNELVAVQSPDRDPNLLYLEHPQFTFDYAWSYGTITAKGVINGQVVAEYSRRKPGKAYALNVEIALDDSPFYANHSDIKMVYATVVDEFGTMVPDADVAVTFSVQGDAEILGNAEIGANPNTAFYGVASAFLRAGNQAEQITVTARATGLQPGKDSIETIEFETDCVLANAKPIYDFKRERIDLASVSQAVEGGFDGQFELGQDANLQSEFLQFGWTAWVSDQKTSERDSKIFPGCRMQLNCTDAEPHWYTQWGFVGNQPYLAIDGVRLDAKGTLTLTLDGLEPGNYEMISYHNHPDKMNRPPASLQILVSDADAKNRIAVQALHMSNGTDLKNKGPARASFSFTADGNDPVVIQFKSISDKMEIVLNGFELSETF